MNVVLQTRATKYIFDDANGEQSDRVLCKGARNSTSVSEILQNLYFTSPFARFSKENFKNL